MHNYLEQTDFLDYHDSALDPYMEGIVEEMNAVDQARMLYYRVRDGLIYDPYHLDLRPTALKASVVAMKKRAWCVEKAILLAALFRRCRLASRLGYAIVINHIGTERLSRYLHRDEIVFHGYVEVYLNDKWIKCTPAFDRRICRLSGVLPLEWNGEQDSLFQEYESGRRFMEYTHFYGDFADVPVDLMNDEMRKYYPHLFEKNYDSVDFSFHHRWSPNEADKNI